MKFYILGLSMLAGLSSQAMHAYRTESCKSQTLSYEFTGNYPADGTYKIGKLNSHESDKVDLIDESTISVSDTNNAVLRVITGKTLSTSSTEDCNRDDDYGYSVESYKTQKVIQLLGLDKEDETKLGVQSGTSIIVNCDETFSHPIKCQ